MKKTTRSYSTGTRCKCRRNAILIVDDIGFNKSALSLMIESKFNVKCDKAKDGLEAFEMF